MNKKILIITTAVISAIIAVFVVLWSADEETPTSYIDAERQFLSSFLERLSDDPHKGLLVSYTPSSNLRMVELFLGTQIPRAELAVALGARLPFVDVDMMLQAGDDVFSWQFGDVLDIPDIDTIKHILDAYFDIVHEIEYVLETSFSAEAITVPVSIHTFSFTYDFWDRVFELAEVDRYLPEFEMEVIIHEGEVISRRISGEDFFFSHRFLVDGDDADLNIALRTPSNEDFIASGEFVREGEGFSGTLRVLYNQQLFPIEISNFRRENGTFLGSMSIVGSIDDINYNLFVELGEDIRITGTVGVFGLSIDFGEVLISEIPYFSRSVFIARPFNEFLSEVMDAFF